MTKILESEPKNILCVVKTHKEIKKGKVTSNVAANLLVGALGGVGGRIVNDFTLTLTDKNLYIDANGYSTWGGIPETNNEDIISIKDIDCFNLQEENNENVITITTNGNEKKMIFICNDENEYKMAIKMYELIPGLK
ncbi:hypothetical protein [Clostridium sp. CF012]|uniref:hypothetical protein n=1 Tax=Clostridium sp. CF012 TaxID=2843319 RepID=UPI001C0BDFF4|nr:hypothetical protein [Clostridium sp. CF012]MBU3142872.1 hypothetical protein [Clostridium sp. CF012]